MKFLTLNLNSIRVRKDSIDWLIKHEDPDIMFFQELKCSTDLFPYDFFKDTEYKHFAVIGQKSYNGVAIVSKHELHNIKTQFENNSVPDEARFISAEIFIKGTYITLISLYVVNGSDIQSSKYQGKMEFLSHLTDYVESINDRPIIVGTDFNICLKTIDAVRFDENVPTSIQEREKMQEFLDRTRLYDVYRAHYPNFRQYTWWSYRAGSFSRDVGFRIDYLLSNISFQSISINKEFRGLENGSDHTYVVGVANIEELYNI